jgi:hypothetical protein
MPNNDLILDAFVRTIQHHGWAVTASQPGTTSPRYAYTVGLSRLGIPELVVTGLQQPTAHGLLSRLADRVVHRAARFRHGQRLTDVSDIYDFIVVNAAITSDIYPDIALRLYGEDRVCWRQVVWPDRHLCFPWDTGYAHPPHVQPLLGRP